MIARNTGAAIKGREALKIVWDDGPNKTHNSAQYRAELEATVRAPGKMVRSEGDAEAALKSAAKTIAAEYYVPYLAHTPMEPPVALVNVADGKCEVWAPVQSAGGTREDLAKRLGLPVDNVTVNVSLLGGGFGRKSKCDYVLEGALLSKAIGAPVQDPVDPRGRCPQRLLSRRLGAADRGRARCRQEGRSRMAPPHRLAVDPFDLRARRGPCDAARVGMGLVDLPFAIPNIRCENGEAVAHTRIGWFRSVDNIQHAFAIQSFVAELAHATGHDPKDFLLDIIGPARIVDVRPSVAKDMFWNYGEP